jgi:hypothetical protein
MERMMPSDPHRNAVGDPRCRTAGLASVGDGGSTDVHLIERVIGEYAEMPGLALTEKQAMRLWACDEATCRRVVRALLERGVLRRLPDGRLVRAG